MLLADCAGCPKDKVSLEVRGDQLVLSGERPDEYTEEQYTWHRTGRHHGKFERSLVLPDNVFVAVLLRS